MRIATTSMALLALLASGRAGAAIDESLAAAGANAGQIKAFVEAARESYGTFGERAAVFLVEGMPAGDLESLECAFLLENLEFALKAREQFAWARELPDELFFNDVLPYASLDETREPWRRDFHHQCRQIVKDCATAGEAAQALNREFFKLIDVHYHTGRRAPNQSPAESRKLGMASCTGLSIILVDACRSVGVPARVAGTALWSNKRGNHTWVEIHDGGEWFFTGADEFNKDGLNSAWFAGDASKALADDWKHAIWATSWKPTGRHFPMVWDLEDKSVPAVNVTARYAKPENSGADQATVHLRLREKPGGERIAAAVDLLDSDGECLQSVTTRAGTSDLNDMPSLKLRTGVEYRLRVKHGDQHRWRKLMLPEPGEQTIDLLWTELGKEEAKLRPVMDWLALPPEERHLSVPAMALTRSEADKVAGLVWKTLRRDSRAERREELDARVVKAAGREMKFLEREFGQAGRGTRPLFISMHGGGGAPARVNDSQWHNQIRLYAPEQGIVVAPRAPTDTWNLWHEGHIDELFQRLIDHFVTERGVDPDRVYLMGYSAGGDGVYQLAPRMADRFAAAAMMAGHPNNASPLGLRNLPFMIFVGGNDAAYDRNKVAADWGAGLAALRRDDPAGYEHKLTVYDGLGHWMDGRDREALPWMAARTRNPWPDKVVWHQGGRTHQRFYWLAVPEGTAQAGQTVRAAVSGQTIELHAEQVDQLILRLGDELLDLDEVITVKANGRECFKGRVERDVDAIWGSLRQRMDRRSVASATVQVKF